MAGTLAVTLVDPTLQERLAPVLEERAPRIDAGDLPAQSTIELLAAEGLLPVIETSAPVVPAPVDLVRAGELLATVAWFDLASAFSLWCHVVTLVYLAFSEPGSPLREAVVPELISARRYGSTALATALGHVQTGRPLPVTAQQGHGSLTLSGFIPWASNLTGTVSRRDASARPRDGTLVVAVARRGCWRRDRRPTRASWHSKRRRAVRSASIRWSYRRRGCWLAMCGRSWNVCNHRSSPCRRAFAGDSRRVRSARQALRSAV